MADILIRGMEMPKEGRKIRIAADGSVWVDAWPTRGYMRMENVYAVQLPAGHGRLIDADAVVKTICNSCDGACDVVQCDCLNCKADCRCDIVKEISDAPTIIEADIEWKMKNCCCFSNTDQAEGGTDDV